MNITRMNRRPASSALLVLSIAIALGACTRPDRLPARTLDSPGDLAAVEACVYDADGATGYLPATACAEPASEIVVTEGSGSAERSDLEATLSLPDGAEGATRSFVAVANSGDSMVHVLDVDLRGPRLIDYDPGLPGNSGVIVEGSPVEVASMYLPMIVAVATREPASLTFADVRYGREITNPTRLAEEASFLEAVPGERSLFFVQRGSRTLNTVGVALSCDGEADTYRDDCRMEVELGTRTSFPVDGVPTGVALGDDGRVYLTRDGRSDVLVVGMYGAALDSCGGSPCELARWSATWECSDGVDNDGDGLADAADPQCFAEDGQESYDEPTGCTNGADDDGDGFVDADDDGCMTAEDQFEDLEYSVSRCEDDIDNDGDGLTDDSDPGCTESGGSSEFDFGEVGAPTDATSLACSDGVDNDLDGLVDYPDDPDCFGPSTDTESSPERVYLIDAALTLEGDFLAVADGTRNQVIFFDTESGERIDVNAGDPLRDALGIFNGARAISYLVPDTIVWVNDTIPQFGTEVGTEDEIAGENVHLEVADRVIHVFTTAGLAFTIDIDRTYILTLEQEIDGETYPGEELARRVDSRFRRRDTNEPGGQRSLVIAEELSGREPGVEFVANGTTVEFQLTESISSEYQAALEDRIGRSIEGLVPIEAFPDAFPLLGSGSMGYVRSVSCTVPDTVETETGLTGISCDDPLLPVPNVVYEPALDDEQYGLATSEPGVQGDVYRFESYLLEDGDLFMGLPRTNVPALNFEATVDDALFYEENRPHDWQIAGDTWEMIYQGILPGGDREDAVFLQEDGLWDGWVTLVGSDPCNSLTNVDPCSIGLDFSECPEAEALCAAGPTAAGTSPLCTEQFDVCTVCPEACAGAVDLCAAGVVPGDTITIRRPRVDTADLECTGGTEDAPSVSYVRLLGETVSTVPQPLEYEIVEVEPDRVRIRVPDGRGTLADPSLDGLPLDIETMASCIRVPTDAEIRSSAWHFRGRDRFGYDSPYESVGNACVLREDAQARGGRPQIGQLYTNRFGLTFEVLPPSAPDAQLFRDFAIRYRIEDGFSDRSFNSRELLLGPAPSDTVTVDTSNGQRLVISDEAQNFLWTYSGVSFFEVDRPLP